MQGLELRQLGLGQGSKLRSLGPGQGQVQVLGLLGLAQGWEVRWPGVHLPMLPLEPPLSLQVQGQY